MFLEYLSNENTCYYTIIAKALMKGECLRTSLHFIGAFIFEKRRDR